MARKSTKNTRLKQYSDDEVIRAVKASFGKIEIAARMLGCAPSTIYDRRESNKEIDDIIKSEREFNLDLAERNLREALEAREQWATLATIRYQGSKRGYIEKQQIEHSGSTEIILKWDENASSDDSPAEDAPEAGEHLPAPEPV